MTNPDKLTQPRQRQHRKPECQIMEGQVCSYKMRKNVREAKHIKNEDSMWELEHGGPASRLIGGEAIPSVLTPST